MNTRRDERHRARFMHRMNDHRTRAVYDNAGETPLLVEEGGRV